MPFIEPHELNKGYSRDWAKSVVNAWQKKHARAADFLLNICHITKDQCEILLQRGRPEWQILKRITEIYERWAQKQESLGQKPLEDFDNHDVLMSILRIYSGSLPEPLKYYLLTGRKKENL